MRAPTWDRRFPASERREQLTRNLCEDACSGDVSAADAAAPATRPSPTRVRFDDRPPVFTGASTTRTSTRSPWSASAWPSTGGTLRSRRRSSPSPGRRSGEIKRHFRDRAWLVRPPRSVQNRVADVRAATEELMAELGRDATREEIAARLDVEVDLVDDARQAADAFHATPMEHDDGSPALTRPDNRTTTSSSPWLSRSTSAGRWSSCPSATGAWSSCGSSTSSPAGGGRVGRLADAGVAAAGPAPGQPAPQP